MTAVGARSLERVSSVEGAVPPGYRDIFTIHRWARRIAGFRGGRKIARMLMLAGNTVMSSSVPLEAVVGVDSVCEHRGLGVVIHPLAVVGARVHILPGVVLGGRGGGVPGAPVIGDDVTIGAGAKILGAVTVGARSVIGANAVVLSDVPCDSLAVGVPAKIRELA